MIIDITANFMFSQCIICTQAAINYKHKIGLVRERVYIGLIDKPVGDVIMNAALSIIPPP